MFRNESMKQLEATEAAALEPSDQSGGNLKQLSWWLQGEASSQPLSGLAKQGTAGDAGKPASWQLSAGGRLQSPSYGLFPAKPWHPTERFRKEPIEEIILPAVQQVFPTLVLHSSRGLWSFSWWTRDQIKGRVLSGFFSRQAFPQQLVFPQPGFTWRLVWGKSWQASCLSHLCFLSSPKWESIPNKWFWIPLQSIWVLMTSQ